MTAADRRPMPPIPPLEAIRNIHVIGICGTAMGSLAALLQERGYRVSGSDAMAYPPMSTWLEARGLTILSGYDASHIPDDADLVVVGNVARRDNPESVAAQERGLPALSMPEVLRALCFPGRDVLAVTGTHGKTTTASMVAYLLYAAERDPSFFIGGVTGNFASNYRLGEGPEFVIEGDEYDTAWFDKVPKFWHYPAHFATINNIEFDHADIYPDLDSILHVFRRFAQQLPSNGELWVNGDDANAVSVTKGIAARVRKFGLLPGNELRAVDIGVSESGMRARILERGVDQGLVDVPCQGVYNLRNFLAAAGILRSCGVPLTDSMRLIAGFQTPRRRQELVGEAGGVHVFDDFAHHPSAVNETLTALRQRFPDARIHAAFEAKSNTSRRAVFQNAYVEAFVNADSVTLAPPWKQDALPEDQKLSIPRLLNDIEALGKDVVALDDTDAQEERLLSLAQPGDVIVTLSGSNFGNLAKKVFERLQRER